MKKQILNQKSQHNRPNYLCYLSTVNLKNYVRTYYGNLVQDVYKNEQSVEICRDNKIGIYFKITYLAENDLDLTCVTEYVLIGQYGHLYETQNGLYYKTIEHIETKNFYKLMKQNISNEGISKEFDSDFVVAHKDALYSAKLHHKEIEKENYRARIMHIDRKYNKLIEEMQELDLNTFFELNVK